VSRLITFPPTSWLLLPWQASPPGKGRSDAAHPVISTPHRLCTSEIPMPKSVSSAVTHRCHHQPALSFQDWHPFTKPVLILAEEVSDVIGALACGFPNQKKKSLPDVLPTLGPRFMSFGRESSFFRNSPGTVMIPQYCLINKATHTLQVLCICVCKCLLRSIRTHHPLGPVIRLGLQKERKKETSVRRLRATLLLGTTCMCL